MPEIKTDLPRCGLLRRLAAIAYDSLLLLAVLFIASALLIPFTGGGSPAPDGAPTPIYGNHPIERALFTTYIFMVAFFFFGWFWTHGGQTLGMRAWRIRVQRYDGRAISWWQALLRYLVAYVSWAAAGLGFLWSLFDREKLTWHDRYSESVLVVMPKKQK